MASDLDTQKKAGPIERLEIPSSRGKTFLLSLGGLLLMAGSVLIISRWLSGAESAFAGICGIVGAIFFGICTLYLIKKLFDSSPGLSLDAEGIDVNTGFAPFRVLWSEIQGLRYLQVGKHPFIAIDLVDPEAIMGRATGLNPLVMRSNFQIYGTPVHLSAGTLKCDFDELFGLMSAAHEKFRASRS